MNPLMSERNFIPRFTAAPSVLSGPTVSEGENMLHGQLIGAAAPMVTVTPADGVSRRRLSSEARLRIVTDPVVVGVHLYDQFSRPIAGCHVVPPSSDTS